MMNIDECIKCPIKIVNGIPRFRDSILVDSNREKHWIYPPMDDYSTEAIRTYSTSLSVDNLIGIEYFIDSKGYITNYKNRGCCSYDKLVEKDESINLTFYRSSEYSNSRAYQGYYYDSHHEYIWRKAGTAYDYTGETANYHGMHYGLERIRSFEPSSPTIKFYSTSILALKNCNVYNVDSLYAISTNSSSDFIVTTPAILSTGGKWSRDLNYNVIINGETYKCAVSSTSGTPFVVTQYAERDDYVDWLSLPNYEIIPEERNSYMKAYILDEVFVVTKSPYWFSR